MKFLHLKEAVEWSLDDPKERWGMYVHIWVMSYGCRQHGSLLYLTWSNKWSLLSKECKNAQVTYLLYEINITCPHIEYEVDKNEGTMICSSWKVICE